VKFFALAILFALPAHAELTKEQYMEQLRALNASLHWKQGEIPLHNGLAVLKLSPKFHYIDHADTVKVLQAWGNKNVGETLGMIFPSDAGPFDREHWGVLIQYSDDGHVKDDDAKSVDYTKLMTDMQAAVKKEDETRKEQHEPQVELLGWATPPKYDDATHKMFWAKELRFEGETENTLNYNIRVLGKEGVLVLNAIATMKQLPLVQKETPELLTQVEFGPGNRYDDFKPGVHKLAGYGLAGLVAGGLVVGTAAKFGIFKILITALLALKKFLVVGVVAAAAGVKKFLKKHRDATKVG